MDFQKANKNITWSLLELTGLLEEEDAHVHFEKTIKHLALHPYHLMNIQRGLNQILKSSLNSYDKELHGFMLTFKNPKLLRNFGELFYDSPFIHVDIEADFYLFRPTVGSFLKGIVNKKGLDHIVVLVHKIYTVSIPKPDNTEEWLGDSVEIGQEIRCCVSQIDNKSKPPFIRAALNSDYLQGCRLSESINIENVNENHNLDSTIKIEKTNGEISEEDISDKERKKHRKKHKKSREIDTKNIKYEDSNMDNTIERHKANVKIDDSINEEEGIVSDKEKKKHRKKHKKSREIDSESFFMNQVKDESNNNAGNDIYRYIKCEINDDTDNIIENPNLNNYIKIDQTSTDQEILEDNAISEKEKRKNRKKHKKSLESDLESISENNNASQSFFTNQIKDESSNNAGNDIYRYIKGEINGDTDNVIENPNLKNSIKIDQTSTDQKILEDNAISEKEKRKNRKKHKKSLESDLESISENNNASKSFFTNQIKDESSNNAGNDIYRYIKGEINGDTDNVIENPNLNNSIKIDQTSTDQKILEDNAISEKEKRKNRKKHKKSLESDLESISENNNASESFFTNQIKAESSNNGGNDIYRYIKGEINDDTDNVIESPNLNNSIKIDQTSTDQKILEDNATSEKEKRKNRKKHKKSLESDLESISENNNETRLNNIDSYNNKNIKCEDNIHNTCSAIENHKLDRVIKSENLTSVEDTTSDREKIKHRKKRKRSHETDTENEVTSDYLASCKKRKKTSLSSDSESKTHMKIKAEKFDSDLKLELKSPIKIKVEKV
ncbi:uncharacterized protein Polr1f [Anoplolepis gracilipes]|uniref:uncharacterized protein Polr1f n=1 Tax=Anoplolepis gracilipes TaxID=354296 RepID=UPI003BA189D9